MWKAEKKKIINKRERNTWTSDQLWENKAKFPVFRYTELNGAVLRAQIWKYIGLLIETMKKSEIKKVTKKKLELHNGEMHLACVPRKELEEK